MHRWQMRGLLLHVLQQLRHARILLSTCSCWQNRNTIGKSGHLITQRMCWKSRQPSRGLGQTAGYRPLKSLAFQKGQKNKVCFFGKEENEMEVI